MNTVRSYEGQPWNELDGAAVATRWKTYFAGKIKEYLGESVLEVGAGLGVNILYLWGPRQKRWTSLEPDPQLVNRIPETLAAQPWADRVETHLGMLLDLPPVPAYDSILYIDVLEHIEHDGEELNETQKRLNPGGNIIVLSPACPFVYTGFDKSLGHYRRYNKASLKACSPAGAKLQRLFHLDSIGLFASVANKLVLHQSAPPSVSQILFWDRYLVTASMIIDRLIGFQAGKTIVAIWTKI